MSKAKKLSPTGPLLKADAIDAFRSVLNLAQALKVTRSAIYQWPEVIPEPRASHVREVARQRGLIREVARVTAKA